MADFKFIDLFAGIGGFRRALTTVNGECVFSSEWDRFAQQTYEANFHEKPRGDITKIKNAEIPTHHILAAGFPCQPFSLAGVSKKNSLGRLHGFRDLTQGTLFFEIQRIIAGLRPDVVLLENVKHLERHNGGKTFEVIRRIIEDELGYKLFKEVIDSSPWVPQRRQRIFMVAFRDHDVHFKFPKRPKDRPILDSILDKKVDPKYTLTDHLWRYLQDYAKKHSAKGNGFGCSVFGPDDVARTLSARYHKDGSEIR